MSPDTLIRIIARRAVEGIESCSPTDRIAIYRGLGLVLPTDEERAAAKKIADGIDRLEREQLSFFTQLNGGSR